MVSLKKKLLFLLLFTFLSLCACHQSTRTPASSDEIYPAAKREIEQVHARTQSELFHRIEGAKIVYANYDLIRRDFPDLAGSSADEIDRWLIETGALMSAPNAKKQVANTKVPVSPGEKVPGQRPPRYGRAAVFEARIQGEKVGLIDAKGVGHFLNATVGPKADGLATLGELLREVLFEKFMAMLLKDAELDRGVVGSYAIIDPGFQVKFANGATKPAGILLRQAHDRQTDHGFIAHPQERMDLSEVFRRYGIITHNNVQGTKAGDLFDFGHYYVESGEGDPALGARGGMWGYNPEYLSGLDEVDQFSPSIIDGPSEASNDLAERLARGEAGRGDVEAFYRSFFEHARFPHLTEGSSCFELLRSILTP